MRTGVGAGRVSTSQRDTIADDGYDGEVGCRVARGDSPRQRWSEAEKLRIVAEIAGHYAAFATMAGSVSAVGLGIDAALARATLIERLIPACAGVTLR